MNPNTTGKLVLRFSMGAIMIVVAAFIFDGWGSLATWIALLCGGAWVGAGVYEWVAELRRSS